jgi:hypothetical protein
MKYVLMFVGSSDDQDAFEKLPKDQLAAAYERAGKWFEEQAKAGRLVGGEEPSRPGAQASSANGRRLGRRSAEPSTFAPTRLSAPCWSAS